MKARVIVTRGGDPSLVEVGIALTRDVLVPAAALHEGYRGYISIYDAEQGFSMAVTLWEDEDTELRSDEAIRASREQLAKDFGLEVSVDTYDVAVVDLPVEAAG